MKLQLRKPILTGGIALSFGLWLWWNIRDTAMEVGELSLVGTIAIGGGFWWLKRKWGRNAEPLDISVFPNRSRVEAAIAQTRQNLDFLKVEDPEGDYSDLEKHCDRLPDGFKRQEIRIAIAGEKRVGKTCLQNVLADLPWENVTWEETPLPSEADEKSQLEGADAVLWLVAGDITDSQLQALKEQRSNYQHIVLVLNQSDRYPTEEREIILQQLYHHSFGILDPGDLLAISASPSPIKVRQHQTDGSVKEWEESPQPDIQALKTRLDRLLTLEREQLICGTLWRENHGLQQEIAARLNRIRRDRALPIIERYQWIAAAAAFANPVAALDLLATAAISAQMLVDLGEIYQHKLSLQLGQETAGELGRLLVKLGIVELSSNAIAHFLKSNAISYVAGGTLQGIGAAYLTRLVGLSLIEYFQDCEIVPTEETPLHWEQFTQKLKVVFAQNQRTEFLQNFVTGAIAQLKT
ncbi:MAG: DUF697 domain-containing protein [Cyanobacteria bacterium P01_E01_bin.42]